MIMKTEDNTNTLPYSLYGNGRGSEKKNEFLADLKRSSHRYLSGGLTMFHIKKYFVK